MIVVVRILGLMFIVGASFVAFYAGKFIYYLTLSKNLARKSVAFEHDGQGVFIKVIGDSTAIGVGAHDASESLSGLVYKKYPNVKIESSAVSGSYIGELTKQFKRNDEPCDVLLCVTGGMDILFWRSKKLIQSELEQFLLYATKKATHVLFVTPLNVGLSPVFPLFFKGLYLNRSEEVGALLENVAKKFTNVTLINNLVIDEHHAIPPWERICAPDMIHPNSAGYRWVFERIEKEKALPPVIGKV